MKQPFYHRPGTYAAAFALLTCLLASPEAQAQFGPVTTYSTGIDSSPRGLAVADVTGDGRADVVTLLATGTSVGVLAGQAGGGFASPVAYPLSGGPHYNVVLADVNLDGRLDALSAGVTTNVVEVLPGLAGGGFGAATTYSTGPASNPAGLAVGDINADGRPDIVAANDYGGTVGVLLGLAGGGFAPVALYTVGVNTTPDNVALADLNGDGRLDVVTSNTTSADVGVLLGQPGGTLGPVARYPTGAGSSPQELALGDVNADGRPDVVVATRDANSVAVLLTQTGGTLAPAVQYPTGPNTTPSGLDLADVNGDNRLDIVVANIAALNDSAGLLLGQAGGTFAPVVTFSTGLGSNPRSVKLADVNGDQRPDLVTVHPGTYGVPGYPPNTLVGGDAIGVLLNTGTYPLAVAAPQASPAVMLYPNPAQHSCHVLLPAGPPAPALLLNALGQSVVSCTLMGPSSTLDLSGLAPGVYTLRLLLAGASLTQQLVVR